MCIAVDTGPDQIQECESGARTGPDKFFGRKHLKKQCYAYLLLLLLYIFVGLF